MEWRSELDEWLEKHLVCPRDRKHVEKDGDNLRCPAGHEYPIIDGIPVLRIDGVPRIRHNVTSLVGDDESPDKIDPYVQHIIAATNGLLYLPMVNRLETYPIPSLPLPAAPRPDLRFLDIGCNWGRWCISSARGGYVPVGIDHRLDALQAARRVAQQLGVSASYVVADAQRLPFDASCFDVVFSYSVLQHFDKEVARQVLEECARTVVEDGTCTIQMPNSFGIRNLYVQIKRRYREPKNFEVRYWRISELTEAFNNIIGPTSIFVEGYFGLGVGASASDNQLPARYRSVVKLSELLRGLSKKIPLMRNLADSVYVQAKRTV